MAWFARSPEVVVTELEDGAVLLNLETRRYYSLNIAGIEIWRLLESTTGPADLAGRLARIFDVDEDRAQGLVSAYVEQLQRERLVVASDHPQSEVSPEPAAPAEGSTKRPFVEPELIQHDEPLHDVAASPFDPQLPLAE